MCVHSVITVFMCDGFLFKVCIWYTAITYVRTYVRTYVHMLAKPHVHCAVEV